MAKQVHYEVFVQRGQSKNWTLLDATPRRDEAIETAKAQIARGMSGARVVKETYDEASGDFMNLTIFEDGVRKVETRREVEDTPPVLPCVTPDDLYSVHARHTMGRLFVDVLTRWKLTVTELIHRTDALERLEATGTVFQHAVQKIAIAQSGSTGIPLVQIIRAMNELADRAMQRVYRESRAKKVVDCENAAELGAFAEARANDPQARLLIGMALASYLAPATSWGDKLDRLLHVIAAPPRTEPARTMILTLADAVAGEILAGASALQELLGTMPDLGSALVAMSDIYLGRVPAGAAVSTLTMLSALFAKDHLLDARTALARRILAEMKTHKRLGPSIEVEMRHLRAITSRLVTGPGNLVPHADIVTAITMRSRRLVDAEAIGEYLNGAVTAIEKANRLLTLEENIVGAENKRRLWDFLRPILTSSHLEIALRESPRGPIERLERVARLQQRLGKSTLADTARQEGIALLDDIALRSFEAGRVAALLAHADTGPDTARALVHAFSNNLVPPSCAGALRDLLKQTPLAA